MADREMTNEEAIEILSGIRAYYNIFDEYDEPKYAALSKAIFALKAEPVKHGHWENYLAEGLRWKCSECGSRFETPYRYCPNCGAKMDEDSHEEPPKLTKEERAFLESFRVTNGKYIYRDGNGRLWLTKDYEEIAELWGTMFPFITHDVENWWSVNELLTLKTE